MIIYRARIVGTVLFSALCLGPVQMSFAQSLQDVARDVFGDSELSEEDLRSFDNYLDTHGETAQDLYRDPDLINDRDYVQQHRSLRDWLEDHPRAARAIQSDPRAVLWRERGRSQRAAREMSERDLRSWEDYLESHQSVARELSRDPELINDTRFVHDRESLDEWLRDHRDAAAIIMANSREYIRRESSSSRSYESESPSPEDLRSFERYLDREWQVADALYREPELVNDRRFLRDNPSLEEWFDDHPVAARAIKARPNDYLWRQRNVDINDFLQQLFGGGR